MMKLVPSFAIVFAFSIMAMIDSSSFLVKAHNYSIVDKYQEPEKAPYVIPEIKTCMECVYEKCFWCGEDQKCYNTTYGDLTGLDCTRPDNYNALLSWQVPARFAW